MDMLRAEEKRWLVVGICLSKVLTPAMRSVIRQEMHQLYQNMVLAPTCIHSQTLSSHHRSLPPSTVRLNYVNINNNATQSSYHSYDYCVKDELSLAKLFVKPFMSGFTGFDETLDLSAALSILCVQQTLYVMELTLSQVMYVIGFVMNGDIVILQFGLKLITRTVFSLWKN